MSNNYKRVVYVGIQVDAKEFLKSIGLDYEEWSDYLEKKGLDISGHDSNIGGFGRIYTDDGFICVGKIIDAEEKKKQHHLDLSGEFENSKFEVTDTLRRHRITSGEVRLYATTLCY